MNDNQLNEARLNELRPQLHSAILYVRMVEKLYKADLVQKSEFQFTWDNTQTEINEYIDEIATLFGESVPEGFTFYFWSLNEPEYHTPATKFIAEITNEAKSEVERKWKSVA